MSEQATGEQLTDAGYYVKHVNITMDQDIIEIGTPSKGGVKIHCDFNNGAETARKIKAAMLSLSIALNEYDLAQAEYKANKGVGPAGGSKDED